jgi:hypothetical protein
MNEQGSRRERAPASEGALEVMSQTGNRDLVTRRDMLGTCVQAGTVAAMTGAVVGKAGVLLATSGCARKLVDVSKRRGQVDTGTR